MIFKWCFVFAFCIYGVFSESQTYRKADGECAPQLNIGTAVDVDKALKYFMSHGEYPPGKNLTCYFYCIANGTGIINKQDNSQLDQTKFEDLGKKNEDEEFFKIVLDRKASPVCRKRISNIAFTCQVGQEYMTCIYDERKSFKHSSLLIITCVLVLCVISCLTGIILYARRHKRTHHLPISMDKFRETS